MEGQTTEPHRAAGYPTLARAGRVRVRPETLERIRAGHRVILDELQPTQAQIDRGLELHYNSFVADVQGSVQLSSTHGIIGDRLQQDLEPVRGELSRQQLEPGELIRRLAAVHFKRKTF